MKFTEWHFIEEVEVFTLPDLSTNNTKAIAVRIIVVKGALFKRTKLSHLTTLGVEPIPNHLLQASVDLFNENFNLLINRLNIRNQRESDELLTSLNVLG